MRRCAPYVSHQIKSVRCIQQVAYQSAGNGIKGQPHPLSLAALGTGAFGDGARAIRMSRSKGSGVAISGNPLKSARMGRYPSYSRSTPQIPAFQTMRRKLQSPNYDRRAFAGLLALGDICLKGLNWARASRQNIATGVDVEAIRRPYSARQRQGSGTHRAGHRQRTGGHAPRSARPPGARPVSVEALSDRELFAIIRGGSPEPVSLPSFPMIAGLKHQ